MKITFDPAKRAKTLKERGLDFSRAPELFEGPVFQREDDRADYGERRIITVGFLSDRMVILAWTQRGAARRIISMRKANDREQAHYAKHFQNRE